MTLGQQINVDALSGLELSKHVLIRLTNDQESIERIAEYFDDDKKFILGVVDFLTDIGWIKQDKNGIYKMTRNGANKYDSTKKTNTQL
jgi:hypothetical protein